MLFGNIALFSSVASLKIMKTLELESNNNLFLYEWECGRLKNCNVNYIRIQVARVQDR